MKSLIRLSSITLFLILNLFYVSWVKAASAPVSATVPSQSIGPAILISPSDNASINTSRPIFSWSRPNPLPSVPINHYDLYLDDALFAGSISDSLISEDFYFYTATASGGTFYINLKTDLAQGHHTWKVLDFTDGGASNTSATRSFYIDSITPFISVTQVDKQTLTWNTDNPSTIPDVSNRYLQLTTPDPLLKGGVETSANIQIVLLCPQNIPSCSSYTYTTNAATGLWQVQFLNLIPGGTYTVKISATDAAGNSTIFPDFFLTYGTTLVTPTLTPSPTVRPTLTATLTPSITPTATISGKVTPQPTSKLPTPLITVTPPPNLLVIITPAPFTPVPPVAPTPPPKVIRAPFKPFDLFYYSILILMIFGLPLHLFMSLFGAATPVRFILKFLLILAFPFLRRQKYQTTPFTFLDIYVSDQLAHPWQSVVSDIGGYYSLKSPIPQNIFVSLSAFGRRWKDFIFKGSIIPITCFIPLPVVPLNDRQRLRKSIYDMRLIPLMLGILTSGIAMVINSNLFVLIYLYLSIQYLFSEYLYPKIQS